MAKKRNIPPVNPGASARKVLIIKLSALGDFVQALGAMKVVRDTHNSAQITLLTTPPYAEFAEKCPYVDVVETDGRPAKMKDTNALVNRIRKAEYDIVYDFQTSDRTGNYFKAMRFPGRKTPLWSGHVESCAFPHADPDRKKLHWIERLAAQLTIAGLGPFGASEPRPDLSWIPAALGYNPRLTPAYFGLEGPYALLIPGASAHREAKRWPVAHYAEIAGRCLRAGITPVLIGAKDEGEINAAIMRAEPGCRNLTTRTDLFQISTLARSATFAIGNDTGPMHMAALSGAPGVALFATRESDPDSAAPRGERVLVVHGETLQEVSPDDVWQAIKAIGVLPPFALSS